ncbi:MAG: hypothetical protein IPG76_11420 [Acidobacteria bacterium]|nr:hypothetical protein [Acidobacteriota bacterium]
MKKMLTVGNKVFYPCQGPCLISSVVDKVVAGIPKSFYHLALLDDSGGELFVPVDMAQPSIQSCLYRRNPRSQNCLAC